MTTKRPNNRRRFILDAILAAACTILILTGLAASVLHLIFQPDRDAWKIAFDWFYIAVTAAIITLVTWGIRRALAKDAHHTYLSSLPKRPLTQDEIDAYNDAAAAVPVELRKQNPNLSPEYKAALDNVAARLDEAARRGAI